MTNPASGAYDPYRTNPIHARFGITLVDWDGDTRSAETAFAGGGSMNPLTGEPTTAQLALIVDDIGSRVNFDPARDHSPFTTESTLVVTAAAVDASSGANPPSVRTVGRPVGGHDTDSLAACTVSASGAVIASAFVRTIHTRTAPAMAVALGLASDQGVRPASLAEMLAVAEGPSERRDPVLIQHDDPTILDPTGHVYGGVAATALELVAHGAIDRASAAVRFRTGSLRVNHLRPLVPGRHCRYVGDALHISNSVAIADARAVGDDGEVAAVARLTAYPLEGLASPESNAFVAGHRIRIGGIPGP
jgi:acyl-coenzyme A thioesterase PaaI-like protein